MLKVQIESTFIKPKNGTSAKTGKPYSIREQEAWAVCYGKDGKPYPHPQRVVLTLDDDQPEAYPIGAYILDPASIYIDRFGQFAIRARLRPAPVAAQVNKAA